MSAESVPAVPLPARAVGYAGRLTSIGTQLALARRLGGRLADGPYRSADGMVMRVDRDDAFQVAMLTGLFSRHAAWMMRRHVRPGSVFIDVGAHIGYFTLLGAQLVGAGGQVHAFEPDPRLGPRAEEHVRENGLDWATVNHMALLDHSGDVSLALGEHLGWTSVSSTGDGVPATATTLDDYVRDRGIDPTAISFVKIDVEGAEADVIKGGRSTLAAARQAAVLVEHPPGRAENPDEIPALMAEFGFDPYVPVRRPLGFKLAPGAVPDHGFDVLFLRRDGGSGSGSTTA